MELLLPAGTFQSGIRALENGADAVYLGLQQFSARKGAGNFTIDELRRLKSYAVARSRNIYIACNTIIREQELPELHALLQAAVYIDADAVIVQDMGTIGIIRRHYPSLTIHASTQMAIHNIMGAAAIRKYGIRRAILARELTLEEITAIHTAFPDLELEVFIHGALCYGFSGTCLASGHLLDRSANRGECGQICRTWFTLESESAPLSTGAPAGQGKDKVHGFFFSMKDLSMREQIQALMRIGVHSAKIEGRMKSPEYTAEAARFYREIIDGSSAGNSGNRLDELTAAQVDDKSLRTVFSRQVTPGWAGKTTDHGTLTTPGYPGHLGIKTGKVIRIHNNRTEAEIKLTGPIAIHDGLMLLVPRNKPSGTLQSLKFSVSRISESRGRTVTQAAAGKTVTITVPAGVPEGAILYKISSHNQQKETLNPASVPLWKHGLNLSVNIGDCKLIISVESSALDLQFSKQFRQPAERSDKPVDMATLLARTFKASGDSLFTAASLSAASSDIPIDRIFIPPSRLKSIRREWYRALDAYYSETVGKKDVKDFSGLYEAEPKNRRLPAQVTPLPPRKLISPNNDKPFPFIASPGNLHPADLAVIDGYRYLPLAPVQLQAGTYFKEIDRLIRQVATVYPGQSIRVGLNNIGHLEWASLHPELEFFADIYLYCANNPALHAIREILPDGKTCCAYYWLEDRIHSEGYPERGLFPIGENATYPLFISRTCFQRNLQTPGTDNIPCRNCGRDSGPFRLTQNGKEYRLYIRDCISYLFPEQETPQKE